MGFIEDVNVERRFLSQCFNLNTAVSGADMLTAG